MRVAAFLSLFVVVAHAGVEAQICSGNLGENIFTEGDFGSGTTNIPFADPQIAPGYLYDPSPPPFDGSYCITNDIGQWANSFNWLPIEDNSNDPNGYMMVVNASFEPGLFYQQTVEGLCENTEYVFSADVHNLIRSGSNALKPNVSFLIDGVEVYNTGFIPENQKWNTYGFTFSTLPGQTSVTLSLANNAEGGIGNDLALDNITFRPCGPEALILPREIANICEDGSAIDLYATINGDQYDSPVLQWQISLDEGITWADIPGATDTVVQHPYLSGGYYYYRYVLANDLTNLQNNKCRVVSNEKIVFVIPKFYSIPDTICRGESYEFGNRFLTESGTYIDSLKTSIGCDSIVTLELVVVEDPEVQGIFILKDPSCYGLEDGEITLDSILNGTPPYSSWFQGSAFNPGEIMGSLSEGEYAATIEDRYGCKMDTILLLEEPDPFVINLGPDISILSGDSVELITQSSRPVEVYEWQSIHGIDCETDCTPLRIRPNETQTIRLVATTAQGCVADDDVFIRVTQLRNIFLPSGFTPNDDGLNDYFTVYGFEPSAVLIESLEVFDRWGKRVFLMEEVALNQENLGWDGTVGGRPAQEGVYMYLANVKFLDERVVQYSGSVTLLR